MRRPQVAARSRRAQESSCSPWGGQIYVVGNGNPGYRHHKRAPRDDAIIGSHSLVGGDIADKFLLSYDRPVPPPTGTGPGTTTGTGTGTGPGTGTGSGTGPGTDRWWWWWYGNARTVFRFQNRYRSAQCFHASWKRCLQAVGKSKRARAATQMCEACGKLKGFDTKVICFVPVRKTHRFRCSLSTCLAPLATGSPCAGAR